MTLSYLGWSLGPNLLDNPKLYVRRLSTPLLYLATTYSAVVKHWCLI